MAKAKHVYRVARDHHVASGMKPGERMSVRMRMLDPEEGAEDHGFEEESAEVHREPPPPSAPARKPKTAAELIKQRRAVK